MSTRIITTASPSSELDSLVAGMQPDKIFLLVDSTTAVLCLPVLQNESETIRRARVITVPAGDVNKSLESAQKVWTYLSENGATRRSLLINLGGGMITDLGGFVAASFKRGIRFVNIPTTLLGAVDAAVGGKTGVNFNGYKNEVGFFANPDCVIISTLFFSTLTDREKCSGFAEMVKMGYVFDGDMLREMLAVDPTEVADSDLLRFMDFCVRKKDEITRQDLRESGLRKLLNFGHTAAHAFESLSHKRNKPLAHGEAVAHGILYALILSHLMLDLKSENIYQYKDFLRRNYACLPFGCRDVDTLIDYMGHDKKNRESGTPSLILLQDIGCPVCDCTPTRRRLLESFEIFNDLN